MGYWPKSAKRRRHNWVTDLGRKLVLLGCTGHHELCWPNKRSLRRKLYVLTLPETAPVDITQTDLQIKAWSEDSATIRGARMMGIIE